MLRNKEIILDERPALTVLNATNDAIQTSLFSVIFSATQQTLESGARYFVLPMALMGDAIRAIFAVSDWVDAKNKNFRKTFRMLLETAKFVVIATAIIGSLAGCLAIAAVTPFLFIGAISSSILYHAALSISHAYHWAVAKGPAEGAHHKQHLFSNVLLMVTGIAVTAAIAVLLAFRPDLGIFNLIIGTVATVMTGITAIYAGISGLSYFKARKNKLAVAPIEINNDLDYTVDSANENSHHLINNTLSHNVNHVDTNNVAHSNGNKIAEKNESSLLLSNNVELVIDNKLDLYHEDLVSDMRRHHENDQLKFINNIIHNKIDKLNTEHGNLNIFYPDKQEIKIKALKMLRQLVNEGSVFSGDTQINSLKELLSDMDDRKVRGTVMSSFWKNDGDVQKIFLLANAYLADKAELSEKMRLSHTV